MKRLKFWIAIFIITANLYPQSNIAQTGRNNISKEKFEEIYKASLDNNVKEINELVKKIKIRGSIYNPIKVIINKNEQLTYNYNSAENNLTVLTSKLINNIWVNYERYIYYYDNNGNISTRLYENWKEDHWLNVSKISYSYNDKASVLTELYENWADSLWVKTNRYIYTYDEKNNETGFSYELWQNNNWVNYAHIISEYDGNNNMLSEIYEVWQNSRWEQVYKYSFEYENGMLQTELEENWINNNWINSSKISYTYDVNGNRITGLNESWKDSVWINSTKIECTYDGNGKAILEVDEIWKDNNWQNLKRLTYEYGRYGLISQVYEKWSNNAWVNSEKRSLTYDEYGNTIKGECFTWLNNEWTPAYLSLPSISYNNGRNRITFYGKSILIIEVEYAEQTGIEKNKISEETFSLLQNYPNPFNPTTKIKFSIQANSISNMSKVSLKVFDIIGREIVTLVDEEKPAGNYEVEFDANSINGLSYASGVYYYSLRVGNNVISKKMVLLK